MKRSEFIDKLHDRCEKELYMMDIDEKEALSILVSFIEEAGMLPPLYTKTEPFNSICGTLEFGGSYVNEWEPEDEG